MQKFPEHITRQRRRQAERATRKTVLSLAKRNARRQRVALVKQQRRKRSTKLFKGQPVQFKPRKKSKHVQVGGLFHV